MKVIVTVNPKNYNSMKKLLDAVFQDDLIYTVKRLKYAEYFARRLMNMSDNFNIDNLFYLDWYTFHEDHLRNVLMKNLDKTIQAWKPKMKRLFYSDDDKSKHSMYRLITKSDMINYFYYSLIKLEKQRRMSVKGKINKKLRDLKNKKLADIKLHSTESQEKYDVFEKAFNKAKSDL